MEVLVKFGLVGGLALGVFAVVGLWVGGWWLNVILVLGFSLGQYIFHPIL